MIKLPNNVPSKYLFVLLAAERAKQLQQGAVPMVKTNHVKPTYRAIDELMEETVGFVIIDRPEPEMTNDSSPVIDSD
jgi:DNA-directed RNA polymerase omega subunit